MTVGLTSGRVRSDSASEWWGGLYARPGGNGSDGGHKARPTDKALADSASRIGLQVLRRRRSDLLLGAFVAVALHGALYCCGWWFPPVKPALVEALVEAERPVELELASEQEPPPALDAPPELVEYVAAGSETVVAPTIVPLDLLRAQAGTITLQYARFSPTLGGGNGGFRVDGSALRDSGRGVRVAVFELADLDQAPVILSQPLPHYPPSLLRTAVAGEVTVKFVVDAEGVVRAERITAATHPEFEMPALQAVVRWKFRPGRKDGRAVATRVEVPIAFSVPSRS